MLRIDADRKALKLSERFHVAWMNLVMGGKPEIAKDVGKRWILFHQRNRKPRR